MSLRVSQDAGLGEGAFASHFAHMLGHSVFSMVLDREGLVLMINARLARVVGIDAQRVLGSRWVDVLVPAPERDHSYERFLRSVLHGREPGYFEAPLLGRGGVVRSVAWVTHVETQPHGGATVSCIGVDVTPAMREREKLLARLNYNAEHDSLTGLVNVGRFHKVVDAAIAVLEEGAHLGILFLSLDRFQLVVDAAGHENADIVVQEVGMRLASAAPYLVSRCGDADFGVLVSGQISREGIMAVAGELVRAVHATPIGDIVELHLSASVGIAFYPDHGVDAFNLIRSAGIAMHQARQDGGNCVRVHDVFHRVQVQDQMVLEHHLHGATGRGEISVAYQPLVDARSRQIVGAEALARWHHPELGEVGPDTFIPVAEAGGLITEIGRYVLDTACRDAVEIMHADGVSLRMSVNMSAAQMVEDTLESDILEVLSRYSMDGTMLEIEITESMLMRDMEHASQVLSRLHRHGVDISLDDFGTGYSCLAYLKHLAVSGIKIDRTFIQAATSSDGDLSLVKGLTALARHLGLRVTAEGVETADQVELLDQEEIDIYQGYFFSRPVPLAEFRALLHHHSPLPGK